jgi:predicted anti-sigma-YlaC factor YlaD
MQAHLTDEQLLEELDRGADATAREHLAACPACRKEHENLRLVLARYAETTRVAAERPEGFWQAQQTAIARRWSGRPVPRRLAWAVAAACVVFAAALLIEKTPPPEPIAQADTDQTLLVDVQRSVRRELPRALEPAALLAREVSRSAESLSNP